jgi:hypothetical protein
MVDGCRPSQSHLARRRASCYAIEVNADDGVADPGQAGRDTVRMARMDTPGARCRVVASGPARQAADDTDGGLVVSHGDDDILKRAGIFECVTVGFMSVLSSMVVQPSLAATRDANQAGAGPELLASAAG